MTTTRETKQDGLDAMLHYQIQLRGLRPEGLIEEKLTQLQSFLFQMARTPTGREELERRVRRFGHCRQLAGETAGQFYGKLRQWLDRDID